MTAQKRSLLTMKTEKTEYCRITVYHKEKNLSAIFDSNGMYETLGDFRVHLLGRGNTIIAASTDAQFLDGNFGKAEYDEKQISCMAYHDGEPIKTTFEVDGVTYAAIQVDGMIYIPDREQTVTVDGCAAVKSGGDSDRNTGSFVKRYYTLKAENPGAVIFYRIGDFYEVLSPDAETVSMMLDLTLTARDCGLDRIPMCGVPHHCVDRYTEKLKDCGFKVMLAGPAK